MIKNANGKERVRRPENERGFQNLPIASEVRSKRVYMVEPINATCWAYMKLLRENSAIKRVYPVNPYAEVYKIRDNVWAIYTESADGMGDPWMYLIEGPEKAMLVDTGFGIGNLKGLCRELVGEKEIIVVNTHPHYDHAYGNSQFDRVYIHEYDAPALRQLDEHIWDYLFQDDGTPIWSEFDRKDIIPWKDYEIVAVPDGHTWDLGGGYEIELIQLGGHTPGSSAFLDKTGRNLYCGDDFVSMRVMVGGRRPGMEFAEYATIRQFRNQVEKLHRRVGEIDHLFPGHFVMDLGSEVIESMVSTLNEILQTPTENVIKKETPRGIMYEKYVPGLGTVAYRDNGIE